MFAETAGRDGSAHAARLHAGMPDFASPFSIDTLLARCAQLEWNPDPTTMLFLTGDDSARGTEEFRTLRSRLYHMREKMPLKKLLVTSALPKEGKSFIASNLAQVMVRQHGRRALLIDADLRAPRLHTMLGPRPIRDSPTTCWEKMTSFPSCSGDLWRIFSSSPAAPGWRIRRN